MAHRSDANVPGYYERYAGNEMLDPYRIAQIYGIRNHAQAHAIKYLLRAGNKAGEDYGCAVRKAIAALHRALELEGCA